MMGYWTSFVSTGDPVAADGPDWPRFTADERGYLDIDDRPSARRDFQPPAFAWADALVAARRREGRGWRLDIGFSAFPAAIARKSVLSGKMVPVRLTLWGLRIIKTKTSIMIFLQMT